MNRRTFVVTAGTAMAVSLAGCIGGGGSGGQGSPEAVVEAAFDAESEDEREELLHPESEMDVSDSDEEDREWDYELAGTEITEEDIDGSYFESQDDQTPTNLSIEDINAVAESETVTVVTATVEFQGPDGETQEVDSPMLTATSGGNWYLLDSITLTAGF